MTPPMGEPNATATPAALAAVTISRILPVRKNFRSLQNWQAKETDFDFAENCRKVQRPMNRYSKLHALMDLPCRLTIQTRLLKARGI